MIASFKCAETKRIFGGEQSAAFPVEIQGAARRKLRLIDNALSLRDLRSPPGNNLERLKGNRAGQYSIRINKQYRICFEWSDGRPRNVEITDYH